MNDITGPDPAIWIGFNAAPSNDDIEYAERVLKAWGQRTAAHRYLISRIEYEEKHAVAIGIAQGICPDTDLDEHGIPRRFPDSVRAYLLAELHYFESGKATGVVIIKAVESKKFKDLIIAAIKLGQLVRMV